MAPFAFGNDYFEYSIYTRRLIAPRRGFRPQIMGYIFTARQWAAWYVLKFKEKAALLAAANRGTSETFLLDTANAVSQPEPLRDARKKRKYKEFVRRALDLHDAGKFAMGGP